MINTLCNGLNPSQVSLWLSLCVDTWDEFGPFTVDALDRAVRLSWKKGRYPVTATAGEGVARRMATRDGSRRDPDQPLPSPPSWSTGRAAGREQMCAEPLCPLCRACHPHGRLPHRGTSRLKPRDLARRSSAVRCCCPQLQKTRSCQTSPAGGTGRMGSAAFLICGARLRAAVGR